MSDDASSVGGRREPSASERLSNETVREVYDLHAKELLAFLIGVLRNVHDANEVSQITFSRLLEVGHTAHQDTIKGWLFKVALREALVFRRKSSRQDRHLEKYSVEQECSQLFQPVDTEIVREEDVSRLRHLLTQLPADQQHVVRQRIYEEKTFATIAEELTLPLGTVLTRMRLALEKLRKWYGNE